jgi:HSP20 family molecular chaperone IbpA
MPPVITFGHPLLLGFDEIERLLESVGKSGGDGYPPYNIERLGDGDGGEQLRIALAVAGFSLDQLSVALEDNQLVIRGRQDDDEQERKFLHRGIAARRFQRIFVLADGVEVSGASLANGLLSISLRLPRPQKRVREIEIRDLDE